MKSKNKIIIITIVILLAAVTVFSAPELITIFTDNNDMTEKNEVIIGSNIQIPDGYAELSGIFAENAIKSEDSKFLLKLAVDGYEISEIESCIEFWMDTDEDISLVKTLLDNISKDTSVKAEARIEVIYDKMTNYENGILTFEEGKEYLKSGLSTEDLTIANKLSRKGVSDIHTILKCKLDTGSMNEEIKNIYSKVERESYNFDGITESQLANISEADFISCIKLSKLKDVDVKTVMGDRTDGFTEEYEIEKEKLSAAAILSAENFAAKESVVE